MDRFRSLRLFCNYCDDMKFISKFDCKFKFKINVLSYVSRISTTLIVHACD